MTRYERKFICESCKKEIVEVRDSPALGQPRRNCRDCRPPRGNRNRNIWKAVEAVEDGR